MAVDTALVCGFLGALLVIIIWLVARIYIPELFNQKNIVEVKSDVDGEEWKVQGDLPCPKCAANLLAEAHQDILKLFEHLKKKYPNDPRVHRLISRYDPDRIYEGRPSPGGMGDTSYSLNKGQRLVFCTRSGRNLARLVEKNLFYFVLLHEHSHLSTNSYGHNKEFNDNFKWLLKEAIEIGMYKPVDYRRYPKEYCGIMVNQSILF